MKHFSHLNTATTILASYRGDLPFHHFLKSFFAGSKKYGSRDRKQIAQICYSWFRTGLLLGNEALETALPKAIFLCCDQSNELLEAIAPLYNKQANLSPAEKFRILGIETPVLFPQDIPLSMDIDRHLFERSHLLQPLLFLRIRPNNRKAVTSRLNELGIAFETAGPNAIALPSSTKMETVLDINRQVVVQDLSSQQTGELLDLIPPPSAVPLRVWDCCAASGGKSIMVWDRLSPIQLTVTDIRDSILANLRIRFREAGIHPFRARVADLTGDTDPFPGEQFDLLVADVPCTGSGTWGRTPEQIRYFDRHSVAAYSAKQKTIALNAAEKLAPSGHLLYITCSAFREENETVVNHLLTNSSLSLVRQEVLRGYTHRADTMFAALLKKG